MARLVLDLSGAERGEVLRWCEAVGLDPEVPTIALATAHPAKFPDAVVAATGVHPPLPDRLADLLDRPEHLTTLPNDLAVVRAHIDARLRAAT